MISDLAMVLVVDDELFFRQLYSDLLVKEGYRVEVCENGEDAIACLQQEAVDLILTDMIMPGKCGLEVLREARLLPNPPEVILVTGYASVETAIQALKNGARDYLVKPFNPDDLRHLVHNCLEQRRLLAENSQLKAKIQLFETGQSLSAMIDLERLIPQGLGALLRVLGAPSGCGFTFKGEELRLSTLHALRDDVALRILDRLQSQIDVTEGFHSLQDLQLGIDGLNEKQLYLLPLGDSAELKAGLLVADVPLDFEQQVSQFDLRYLCDQIVLGFENACRLKDAQELMYTDDLTGLHNHRYLQVALDQEIRRSQRYGLQFSLLFLDLDRFKLINDQYGHLAGSAALQEVGILLRKCVRDVDTLFRFGGDEFAAMLLETDARDAEVVAERIRKTIEGHLFLADRGLDSKLTATAGFATFPSDAVDKTSLLELADKAMYAGKNTRNVVRGFENLQQ